jgi:polysaccharide export outer membrane protein
LIKGLESMSAVRKMRLNWFWVVLLCAAIGWGSPLHSFAADARPVAAAGIQPPPINAAPPSVQLGPGDTVAIKVFGQPDMDGTVYVADDGTIHLPLVGSVPVAGLSPDQVSRKVEKALKDGSFLVNPHVTLTLTQSVNQLVAVLGEVKAPGRYQVSANTSIFQLLAQAGGVTANSADVIYLIRSDADGKQIRTPIDLKGYTDPTSQLPTQKFRGGDSVFVPHADLFYIYGEVTQPNEYRLEDGMSVVQAIARAGGLTPRGSDRRVDIKRKSADGSVLTFRAKQSDLIQANDVVHVKESIF